MHMSRHGDPHLLIRALLNSLCHFIGYGRIFLLFLFLPQFLLGQLCVLLGDSAFCNRNDGKSFACCLSLVDGIYHHIRIVRDLRQKDDIRAAGNACMKGHPANLMSHNFDDKYPAVRGGRGVDLINGVCGYIHRTLETKGHIRSPQIIVNGLWKRDDVQAFFSQHVCRLMCAVASQDHQAVQVQLVVGMLHGLYLVQSVFVRHPHQLEGLPGCPKDRSAQCQDSGKVPGSQHLEIGIDQSFISFLKSIDFYIVSF